ncbi:hypothetical protein SAMCFNEI73_pC0124 (plasmid) [Sinorhizobium americanum]|uniref:Uncharacterized protein n=1 Tax=Sinorhizobium americanum TaxID=194963 RepID=A0A1L3LUV5_9HYPH|nr:hypothetical protein SAMCFNEI73_pC0124 [Sinorhizobium americanum]
MLVQWHIQKAPISAQVIVIRSVEGALASGFATAELHMG